MNEVPLQFAFFSNLIGLKQLTENNLYETQIRLRTQEIL